MNEKISREKVFEIVKDLTWEQFGGEKEKITEDFEYESVGADSLDFAELAMELEDEFNINLEGCYDKPPETLRDVVSVVTMELNKREDKQCETT